MRLTNQLDAPIAPNLAISEWINSTPLSLKELRGRVVVLHAFQMLCPGCVLHGTPLAQKLHDRFASSDPTNSDVAVIGIHTVFEHHGAMTSVSLRAYLHEFRITMPIGIDEPGADSSLPTTMQRYDMRGTPTLILIDRQGKLRAHSFGSVDEIALGMSLARLIDEPA
jgi:peroxiredoxin